MEMTYEQEVRARTAKRLRMSVSEVEHIIDTYVDEHIALQREHYAQSQRTDTETIPAVTEQQPVHTDQPADLPAESQGERPTPPSDLDTLDGMMKPEPAKPPRTPRKSRAKAKVEAPAE
jgi:hypothetical protein